jgi:hypothetical protein
LWGVLVGTVTAWLYVAPIAFNQGALQAVLQDSDGAGMVGLTPYPQLYDDRIALYASAIVSMVLAFGIGLPVLARRVLSRWTAATLILSTGLGIFVIFVWMPRFQWLWLVLALLVLLGGICVAGEPRHLAVISAPAWRPLRSVTGKSIIALLAALNAYLIIPAATGTYIAGHPHDTRGERLYLLLYMKDPTSSLHEEVVQLVASTTEYLVVRLSDKVPHPRQHLGPSTLPVDTDPMSVASFGPAYFPMLIRRDSVDAITPSLDPDVLIATLRELFSRLPLTTQPVFRIGRDGAAVKIWTEAPQSGSQPASPPLTVP